MSLCEVLFARGVELHSANLLEDALTTYDQALALDPNHAEALYRRGAVLWSLNRLGDALASTNKALSLRPRHLDALYNRGVMLRQMGLYDESLVSLRDVLAINPRHVDALINYAHVLQQLNRHEEAISSLQSALIVTPESVELLNSYGNTLQHNGRYREALSAFDRAIAISPRDASLRFNRANVLSALRRFDDAIKNYDRAIELNPHFVDAYNNRGAALKSVFRFEEALKNFETAIALKKDDPKAFLNAGGVLQDMQRHQEALGMFKSALAIAPAHPEAVGGLTASTQYLCDWACSEHLLHPLRKHIEEGRDAIAPFALLGICDEPEIQRRCGENHIRQSLTRAPVPLWNGTIYKHDRVRLVYLSPDFRRHPVAYHIAPLFERHDRSQFEVIAISIGPDDGSEIRARIERGVDKFCDARTHCDEDVARFLRHLEADIIVDLGGHTRHARSAILSYRPSPVQVNYLGYAATMGADFMDYVIGDRIVLPREYQPFFSEKIVHLPDCYHAVNSERPLENCKTARSEVGLPENGFVFCCFNSHWKINRDDFERWMRLLNAVPGSVLWLKATHDRVKENLSREARASGIDAHRLVFAAEVKFAEHLARHQLADLFLDTNLFNGHTTAIDALWAGLPLVTLKARSFAGRVAASILNALGLSELATDNPEEFERLALHLARNRSVLESYRKRLMQNRADHPLFDMDGFRRNIEKAFKHMRERVAEGKHAQGFSVDAL